MPIQDVEISFKPLQKLLVDIGMKRIELLEIMSSATLAKLEKNEYISLGKVEDIINFLNKRTGNYYTPNDIIGFEKA